MSEEPAPPMALTPLAVLETNPCRPTFMLQRPVYLTGTHNSIIVQKPYQFS